MAIRKSLESVPAAAASVTVEPVLATTLDSVVQFVPSSDVTLCNWYCLPRAHGRVTLKFEIEFAKEVIWGNEFESNGFVPASASCEFEKPSPSASKFGSKPLAP